MPLVAERLRDDRPAIIASDSRAANRRTGDSGLKCAASALGA